MSERFFVADKITAGRVDLVGDEARHLAAVMRAQPGDEVVLFDGSGVEFVGRVAAVLKRAVQLEVVERREISRELPCLLTLAVALPKGERQKWLVEKATELGVTRLVPLVTERGVAQPADAALDRLRRTVIEASKQCGRNRLLEIAQPMPVGDYLRSADLGATRLFADAAGTALDDSADKPQPGGDWQLAIGPEGGFTPAEVADATAAGWWLVSLGPRILRVETAAVMLAAWAAARAPLGLR
jgi:16S rRNA (uracil1498-N3)-methyltransferase